MRPFAAEGAIISTYVEQAFKYAIENEARIRSLLLKAARGDKVLAEEMYSDVALERLPRLFELYDGVRPVENYMLNNIRWYAFKYVNQRFKRSFEDLEYVQHKDSRSFLDALEYLTPMERYLIEAHVFYKMTNREISEHISMSVPEVKRQLQATFEKLRIIYAD